MRVDVSLDAAGDLVANAPALGPAAAKADGRNAVAHMKATPTNDDCFGPGTIRGDGRKIHPSYLLQAKTPAQSKGPFDVLQALATTPADEAFRAPGEGGCGLIRG